MGLAVRRKTGREPAGNRAFQFSIGHMLLWMVALVPILLLAQGIELWFLTRLFLWDWLALVSIAIGLALVSLVAIGVVLGSGPAAIRIATLALVPGALSIVAALVAVGLTNARGATGVGSYRITDDLAEIGWGWVAWTLLAAWFLAGLLLMFRSSGYRLVRTARRSETGPAAEEASPD